MSRKGASSKFGHLFGDSSADSSSSSSSQNRLSTSGDLYRDPLAAMLPPVTATTSTTRSTASTAKATLSPTTSSIATATAAAAVAGSSKSSPPGSASNSRSSSRLQHQSLFSSLTGDGGSSLFDSASPASASLSAAKRDLLFGESSSSATTSSSRRTSTPPLSKSSNTTTTATSQQSSRVSTPPLGVRATIATTLDANSSPLGALLGDNDRDDEVTSARSPLSTEPVTRTNSQASTKSLDSGQSVKSVQSQDTNGSVKPPAAATTGPSPLSSVRSTHVKKGSVDQQQQHSLKPTTETVSSTPNPLAQTERPQPPARLVSSTSSQSIEAFQSISRSSSPAITSPPVSKSGFEQDDTNLASPPISQSRRPIHVDISDDATEAFAKDLLLTSEPASHVSSSSTLRTSSFLDSGFASSQSMASFSSDVFSTPTAASTTLTATVSTTTTSSNVVLPSLKSGGNVGTINQLKSTTGFSLGEDVEDSSNPWMNSLADSLKQTKLSTTFTPPAALSTAPSPSIATTNTPAKTSSKRVIAPIPISSLEDDVGGFSDVFSPIRINKTILHDTPAILAPPSPSPVLSRQHTPSPSVSGATSSSSPWSMLNAVEAASMDPEFLGATSLASQSSDKVISIMQMPKHPLEKDVSAMEEFDNPWE